MPELSCRSFTWENNDSDADWQEPAKPKPSCRSFTSENNDSDADWEEPAKPTPSVTPAMQQSFVKLSSRLPTSKPKVTRDRVKSKPSSFPSSSYEECGGEATRDVNRAVPNVFPSKKRSPEEVSCAVDVKRFEPTNYRTMWYDNKSQEPSSQACLVPPWHESVSACYWTSVPGTTAPCTPAPQWHASPPQWQCAQLAYSQGTWPWLVPIVAPQIAHSPQSSSRTPYKLDPQDQRFVKMPNNLKNIRCDACDRWKKGILHGGFQFSAKE